MNPEAILTLLTERETEAGERADELRGQITTLTDQLATIDNELADLATTRTTLLRLTGGGAPSTGGTPSSPAYQQVLAVFATTDRGLRAKDICHALGLGTIANHIESLRAKLKRLVNRSVLIESEPRLFTLAQPTTSSPIPTPES